ncbi:MAG TPA: cupin domain-containing protein [Sphingomicrobium sp.]|nr:cupin domain-containing protein [Sphingomicrobium sp.]
MGKVSFDQINSLGGATPVPASEFFPPAREISFAEIICPDGGSIEDSDFARHFREKKMLHIAQDDRTRFEHLLTWEMINDLLSLNMMEERGIRITRDGRDVPTTLYRTKAREAWGNFVDSRKLHDLVKQNASIAINSIQFLSPPIRRLANQVEIALGQEVWVNCYMTFGGGGAFAMHFDPHDVIVLQLQGSKHWFLYEDPEPAPLENAPQPKPPAPREVAFETNLQAGDVLFVPRGTYHRAAVTDSDSLHLTIGIHTFKGVKFIDFVRSAAEKERFFREDVSMLGGPEDFAEQERLLKARLCELVNQSSLSKFVEEWQLGRQPVFRFHLGPNHELDDDTMLAPLLRSRQAWAASVNKKGKEPSPASERIVESLIERNSATIGELKAEFAGVLDEDTIKSTLAELLDDCWIEVVR